MTQFIRHIVTYITFFSFALFSSAVFAASKNTQVLITTNMGTMEVELFDARTPKTVANFLGYIADGYYNGTIFHRVIPNFMIQGGGFTPDMTKKNTNPPIKNEANAFIPNLRGTLSMARTNDPHSATSQFFINVVDNRNLNKTASNPGYAVFGKVIKGMGVADNIARAKTKSEGYMRDIPVKPIVIESITVIKDKASENNNSK